MGVLQVLAGPHRAPRIGTVVDVAGGVATVDVDGGVFTAQLSNETATVGVGALVALLPIGDTWLVIASLSDGGAGGPVYGSNLIPNPSMEFGAPGAPPTNWDAFWTSGPAVTSWDDTPGDAHTGGHVARVVLSPTTDAPNTKMFNGPMALDAGVNYRCSAWLKASSATSNNAMAVIVISAPLAANAGPFGTGSVVTTMATVTLPGGAYQEAFGTFTLPAGHHFASLFLSTTADAGADLTAWWDDAAIRQIITT